jgi:hypothetical protein
MAGLGLILLAFAALAYGTQSSLIEPANARTPRGESVASTNPSGSSAKDQALALVPDAFVSTYPPGWSRTVALVESPSGAHVELVDEAAAADEPPLISDPDLPSPVALPSPVGAIGVGVGLAAVGWVASTSRHRRMPPGGGRAIPTG